MVMFLLHRAYEGSSALLIELLDDSERTGVFVENEAVWSTVQGAQAPKGEHTTRVSAYFYELSFAYDPPWTQLPDPKSRASALMRFVSRGCCSATSECNERDGA